MNLLDSTIVTVAAPAIRDDLGGGDTGIQWLSAAYTLPLAALLIVGGRLGDITGRRRVFRCGVTVFTMASLACACAPAMWELIGLRAVQGAGAALAIPQTIGLVKAVFAGPAMSRALSAIGPVMGVAAVLGPVIGGVVISADVFETGWRAVFLVNVPAGCAVLAASVWLPESRAARRPDLDIVGATLLATGIGLIVFAVVQGDSYHWHLWVFLVAAAGLAPTAGAVVHVRHRAAAGGDPVIEPRLLRSASFTAALSTSTLFFAVVSGLVLVAAVQLESGVGYSALRTAAVLCPWSVGLAVSSLVTGRVLAPRFGFRLLPAGAGIMAAGIVICIVAYLADDGVPAGLSVGLAAGGIGYGVFSVPFFTTALAGVRPEETGSAAGLLNCVQQVGATLGVAVLASVYFSSDDAGETTGRAAAHAFGVPLALIVAASVTSLPMRPRARRPH